MSHHLTRPLAPRDAAKRKTYARVPRKTRDAAKDRQRHLDRFKPMMKKKRDMVFPSSVHGSGPKLHFVTFDLDEAKKSRPSFDPAMEVIYQLELFATTNTLTLKETDGVANHMVYAGSVASEERLLIAHFGGIVSDVNNDVCKKLLAFVDTDPAKKLGCEGQCSLILYATWLI